jgi:hypothetical protein
MVSLTWKILPLTFSTHTTTLSENDSQLKAYVFLHKLIAQAMLQLRATMPVPPALALTGSIPAFGWDLILYYATVETIGSGVLQHAQSIFFLTSLWQAGIEIDSFMDRVRAIPATTAELPIDLVLSNLVLQIADLRTYTPTGPHIHCLAVSPTSLASTTGTSRTALVPRHPTNQAKLPFRTGADEQCASCGRWGHTRDQCIQLATTYLCLKYISANEEFSAALSRKLLQTQDKSNLKNTIRLLRHHHPADYDDQTDDDLLANLDFDGDSDFV